jgi:hypothetical protein
MARVIRLCVRNEGKNSIKQYGMQQRDLRLFPMNDNTRVVCPDGSKKTLSERLASVDDIPNDDRGAEIASAGFFGATAATSEIVNLNSGPDSLEHMAASTILTIMVTVTVLDNFYDVIKTGSQFVASQIKSENQDKFQLPDKETLPFGLGSGALTGSIVRGFSRLFTVDTVRESQCEAAALYTAYVLGLPCFAYRSNALEASVLVAESATKMSDTTSTGVVKDTSVVDNLLTTSGILRILVWLLAPVAMEHMTHPQLIMSDPREAEGFLRRVEEYYGPNDDRLFWRTGGMSNESSTMKANLLKWAYTEADALLRNNKSCVLELSDRLTSGAATIGDCIAVLEGW